MPLARGVTRFAVRQDVHTALRMQMKLVGGSRVTEIDTDAFLAQAAVYEVIGDLRDGVLKVLNIELLGAPGLGAAGQRS